jgi:protein-tyrosine kinase
MTHQAHPVVALPLKGGGAGNIGGILQELGRLTGEEIERVLEAQRDGGLRFGEAARRLGLIGEADVQQVLARQFDCHYLQPGEGSFPEELVAAYQPFSPQVEMLRAVRTQLMQRWFSPERKCLAIASVNPGEGVSFLAANLGVVFSQLGQKTLVIDANLRNPRQQDIFGLAARQGLSDILAHRAGMETFFKVEAFPHLNILPAGTLPPNPQELLARASFSELKEALAARFDVILIDAPAFYRGADALTIAARAGGVLVACRKDRTSVAHVNAVSAQLSRTGVEVAGSVLIEY